MKEKNLKKIPFQIWPFANHLLRLFTQTLSVSHLLGISHISIGLLPVDASTVYQTRLQTHTYTHQASSRIVRVRSQSTQPPCFSLRINPGIGSLRLDPIVELGPGHLFNCFSIKTSPLGTVSHTVPLPIQPKPWSKCQTECLLQLVRIFSSNSSHPFAMDLLLSKDLRLTSIILSQQFIAHSSMHPIMVAQETGASLAIPSLAPPLSLDLILTPITYWEMPSVRRVLMMLDRCTPSSPLKV